MCSASSCLYGNQCAAFDYCGKSDDRMVLVSMDLVLKIALSLQNLHLGALDSITAGKGQMALSWWYFWLDGSKKSGAGGGWYNQTTSFFQSNQVWATQIPRTKLQQVNSIQHTASKDKQSVFGEPSWLVSDALLFYGGDVSSWVSWGDTVWDTWGKIGREVSEKGGWL